MATMSNELTLIRDLIIYLFPQLSASDFPSPTHFDSLREWLDEWQTHFEISHFYCLECDIFNWANSFDIKLHGLSVLQDTYIPIDDVLDRIYDFLEQLEDEYQQNHLSSTNQLDFSAWLDDEQDLTELDQEMEIIPTLEMIYENLIFTLLNHGFNVLLIARAEQFQLILTKQASPALYDLGMLMQSIASDDLDIHVFLHQDLNEDDFSYLI